MAGIVRFTTAELELIQKMIEIAKQCVLNEGDYQGWLDEGKDETLFSLSAKVEERLARR